MAAIVGIDGRIDMSTDGGTTYVPLPERNSWSLNIAVDVAEHKPFVASLSAAWVEKARTWMNWSGSIEGYYDDASNAIVNQVVAGTTVLLRFYVSRADTSNYLQGSAILTSVDQSTGTEDFSTLNVDFEGSGVLTVV